jgi:hypothetical protein
MLIDWLYLIECVNLLKNKEHSKSFIQIRIEYLPARIKHPTVEIKPDRNELNGNVPTKRQ